MRLAEKEQFLANAPASRALSIDVASFGLEPYVPVLERMRSFTEQRGPLSHDQIWLVEHEPVFTLGQAAKSEHLLDPTTSIPVVKVERGGQITYHAPGQIIAYTLIDLRRRGILVRQFVCLIEAAVMDTLAAYNLCGIRKPGAPGIYVQWQGDLAKIAALGLKVRNGSTFHGVALNVDMDLSPFGQINPCGYAGLKTVDLNTLGVSVSAKDAGQTLAQALVERIERKDFA